MVTESCEQDLSSISEDLKWLKLSPGTLRTIEGEDKTFVDAIIKILSFAKEPLLSRLAQSVLENPPAKPRAEILGNPYFARHANRVRPFSSVTLPTLEEEFSDLFSDYELGLLADLIPESSRVDDRFMKANGLSTKDGFKKGKVRFFEILLNEHFRAEAHALLRILRDRPQFMSECILTTAGSYPSFVYLFEPKNVDRVFERQLQGSIDTHDDKVIVTMMLNLFRRMKQWSTRHETPETQKILRSGGRDGDMQLFRTTFRRHSERYLTEVLKIDSDVAVFSNILRALVAFEPLPVESRHFRQSLLMRIKPRLKPIFARASSSIATESDGNKPRLARPVAPTVFETKDFFAPPNGGRRTFRGASSPDAEVDIGVTAPRVVADPELDLHRFSSFVENPDEIKRLQADRNYEFSYMRDHLPVPRFARFSPAALDFMFSEPIVARQIISAINLGEYRGQLSGIKPLHRKSRQTRKQVYELRIYASYRPLMMLVDGVWQVIKVVHKDDVDLEAQFVKPLDPL